MPKRSKFIRLHGTDEGSIISVRHNQIDVIVDLQTHRTIKMRNGSGSYDVRDTTDEIVVLVDGRKRVTDRKERRHDAE